MRKYPTPNSSVTQATVTQAEAGLSSAVVFIPDDEAIAKLAYRLWAERGRPEGSAEEDWFRAKELLSTGRAVIASST